MKSKLKILMVLLIIVLGVGGYLYFKYFFSYEQKNITKRKIETITGQDLTITVFGLDGKIIKRWTNVKKITSAKGGRNYTYFYTKNGRYVQIPDSVWYVAEENKIAK